LVVASLAQPVAVERNRYKDRWIFNGWPRDRRPQEAEEFSQLSTQAFATMKLQLQDGGSQVAGVKVEAPCEVECIFLTAALGAEGIGRLKSALTGEEKAASETERTPPGLKALPAFPANAGAGQPVEFPAAQGAVRWKESGKQTIDELLEERRGGRSRFISRVEGKPHGR
jgi:hypothetical protein